MLHFFISLRTINVPPIGPRNIICSTQNLLCVPCEILPQAQLVPHLFVMCCSCSLSYATCSLHITPFQSANWLSLAPAWLWLPSCCNTILVQSGERSFPLITFCPTLASRHKGEDQQLWKILVQIFIFSYVYYC